MKMNRKLIMHGLMACSLFVSHAVLAQGEPIYHFLPSDTVIENVKSHLQSHGVDTTAIEVDADAQGVVQLQGEVASKQAVETVTQLAKEAPGVYAVLGALRYGAGEPVPAPVPEGLDPVMDAAPAAGPEVSDDAQ